MEGVGECISTVNKHRADYQVLCVAPVWHSELTVCTPRSQGNRVNCLRVWKVRMRASGAFPSNCLRKLYDIVWKLSKWMIWVLPRLWESWANSCFLHSELLHSGKRTQQQHMSTPRVTQSLTQSAVLLPLWVSVSLVQGDLLSLWEQCDCISGHRKRRRGCPLDAVQGVLARIFS